MKLYIVMIGLLFIANTAISQISLIEGVTREGNIQLFKNVKARYGYRPSYLVSVKPDKYYGLSSDGKGVAYYDLSVSGGINGWPLTRWPYEVDDAEVAAIYAVEGAQEGDVWDRYESNR
ncbi:hypothetical protein, partial [Marinagarivorans algicola]|uniref:hypothetical protein n=1 Tax=Marinagarivorans algicola TaxID=1513270 RepID=UPI0012E160FC